MSDATSVENAYDSTIKHDDSDEKMGKGSEQACLLRGHACGQQGHEKELNIKVIRETHDQVQMTKRVTAARMVPFSGALVRVWWNQRLRACWWEGNMGQWP